MDSVYRGGGWGAKGSFSIHCVLMEVQKGAQCTFQTEKVVGSSFVHPSGNVHPTVGFNGFTKSQT